MCEQQPKKEKQMRRLIQICRSKQTCWYFITIGITSAVSLFIFVTPEKFSTFAYLRNVLASILILWLPGYTFGKALFPGKELDRLERSVLSIGISLVISFITGLLLNYTPWGINPMSVTVSLVLLTLIFATIALLLEDQIKLKK